MVITRGHATNALHRCPLKPRIAPCPLRVPQCILLEAFTPPLPIGIRPPKPRRVRSILGWLPLRPLQVTWEMTQACDSLPPKASNEKGSKNSSLGGYLQPKVSSFDQT